MMHAFRILISALGAAGVTDPACVPDTSGDWPYANQPPGFFAASNIICSPSDEQDEPKTCSAQSTTSNSGCDLADNAPYCKSQQTTCASDDTALMDRPRMYDSARLSILPRRTAVNSADGCE